MFKRISLTIVVALTLSFTAACENSDPCDYHPNPNWVEVNC